MARIFLNRQLYLRDLKRGLLLRRSSAYDRSADRMRLMGDKGMGGVSGGYVAEATDSGMRRNGEMSC